MIDDSWWTGAIEEVLAPAVVATDPARAGSSREPPWCPTTAAAHFLSLNVRWDNGELERLSPWDLEPIDPAR